MDMEAVPAAVVLKERTPAALAFTRDLSANKQFAVRTVQGRPQAEALLEKRDIEFILEIPNGFERALTSGRGQVQLTIYGVDSNSAVIFPQLCRRHLGADRCQDDSGGAHPFERAERRSAGRDHRPQNVVQR